jgi:hypothetical protein
MSTRVTKTDLTLAEIEAVIVEIERLRDSGALSLSELVTAAKVTSGFYLAALWALKARDGAAVHDLLRDYREPQTSPAGQAKIRAAIASALRLAAPEAAGE